MGNYICHRPSRRLLRRVAVNQRWAPSPEDEMARRQAVTLERQRQAQLEAEKRARMTTRARERETRRAEAARLEAMARDATFPWETTEHLVRLIESSGSRFNRGIPFTSRAAFWGSRLVFGPAMGAVYASLSGDRLTPSRNCSAASPAPTRSNSSGLNQSSSS